MKTATIKSEVTSDTRQRIIDAATEAMIAKSYNGTGLNEILTSAGVPKGSFYHFFKSKENLGIAVVEKAASDHLEELRRFCGDRTLSPRQRLRTYFDWIISHAQSRKIRKECVICKLALEQADMSELMKAAIRCSQDQARAIFTQVIREAQAAGEIGREHNAELLSDFVKSALSGAMIRVHVEESTQPLLAFRHYVLDVLLFPQGTTN